MKREHEHGKPCPITDKSIPNDYFWTNHQRKGWFNACAACDNQYPKSLHELNKERRLMK